jgi:glycosyltransferase involved in cell wall biosynthesis
LLRKKVILHIHSGYFYKFLIGLKGAEKKLIFFLLHRLNAFIVLSEEMRANIQGFLPHKPIYVLRNPINVKSAQISDHHIRAQSKLLYLGWYITEKGVYDLVDAISILTSRGAEINLEFYGTKQIKKLQSYVKSKGLEGVISVNGWIDGPEKSAALHQATALVLPSYSEGIPNVILEAMATKTPIISTLVGGLKEILQDEENAIIAEPGNPKDLSEKILKCIKDEELRNKIASKAYDDVVTKYDIAIIKKELSLILEQFSHSAPTAI